MTQVLKKVLAKILLDTIMNLFYQSQNEKKNQSNPILKSYVFTLRSFTLIVSYYICIYIYIYKK